MKELLSRIGIGAATVDTVLPSDTLTPGESVDVTIAVEGGATDQQIDSIYFALCTEYLTDEDARKRGVVGKSKLRESFTIEAGAERTFDATIPVPIETPVTAGRTKVWVETGLDVDWALDPDDTDHVQIEPHSRVATILDAFDDLGFGIRSAQPIRSKRGLFTNGPRFVQEFEFVPRSGEFQGRLDEVEAVLVPDEDSVDVHLEVDKRGGLFSEALDVDEQFDRFDVTTTDSDAVRDELRSRIERNC